MALTDAKQLARDVFERGFGQGELEAVDAALDSAAVDRHAFRPDEPDMATHLKGAIQMIRGAFPDLMVKIGHLIQEDHTLAVRVEVSGHHTGTPMFGIDPTGAEINVEQFHIIEVNDQGQGLHHWANVGIEQMQAQLRQAMPVGAG